ncbi:hypothetical protein BaRGS_00032564 [Batillaria attramentaria]|uniref:Exostosin-2 n=1 Tax=Batillaria attramentaria TaxID=370345 RepID=A0ABD0JMG1_9CAEN
MPTMRSRRRPSFLQHSPYAVFAAIAFVFVLLTVLGLFFWPSEDIDDESVHRLPRHLETDEVVHITRNSKNATERNVSCTFHTCMNVYHCGYNDETKISVYVYPIKEYVDENGKPVVTHMSREFAQILQAIVDSPFYSSNPETACVFVPSVDLLNQNNVFTKEMGKVLASLPWWNQGTNHLLFNMLPGTSPHYNSYLEVDTGNAIVAGGGFSSTSHRRTFDISVPVFNPLVRDVVLPEKSYLEGRQWLVVSSQMGLHEEYKQVLRELQSQHPTTFLLLDACPDEQKPWNYTRRCHGSTEYKYPEILQEATFCLVIRGARLGSPALSDALMAGCIPIVVADGYVMPFSDVLDWIRASAQVREDDLGKVMEVVGNYSVDRVHTMRRQVQFLWKTYFSSMTAITMTTLQVLNSRIFPYAAKTYNEWNEPPDVPLVQNPLFLPLAPSKAQGFTAVVLTYDRLDSLFTVIRQLAAVPSLAKVLVVWNNQNKQPPPLSSWPYIGKTVKVVQTKKNKLSNRFFPYDEIETECILALDDDIVMLTADELEFGYEVWREFPDRLVGFPSRLHLWDNTTQKWRYESEWTNAISMVLTGAAFYHKAWVDDHMNCEDIAMNFLIANTTGNAPIKVAPRKKFKCPQCTNTEMLSADITHMVERSECINQFAAIYQSMPLRTVEFRADPVLYKDNFPSVLKKFNDIGSL